MNKQEFSEIEKNIIAAEKAKINILKCHKFKKFNYLKCNPQRKPTETKNEDVIEDPKLSYPSTVKS